MAYKFAFIIKGSRDYIRRPEVEFFGLNPEAMNLQFDSNGIAYVQEDVNRPRTDEIVEHLEENGFEVRVVSKAEHRPFVQEEMNFEYIDSWLNPPVSEEADPPISQSQ